MGRGVRWPNEPPGRAGAAREARRGGRGMARQKGSRVGEAQLANLRIYPPQSLALFRVDELYDTNKTIYVETLIIAFAKNLVGVIR